MLSYFERSTVFDPELLQKVLSHQASSVYIKSVQNYEDGGDFCRGIAMIQGIVDSDSPLKSSLNSKTKLVVRALSQEQIFSNKRLLPYSSKNWVSESIPVFNLKSAHSNESVKIQLNPETQIIHAMNLVQMNSQKRRLRFFEKILSWGVFALKILTSFSPYLSKKLTGFELGTKTIERGIKIG